MQAIQVNEAGAVDKLQYVSVAQPELKEDEVLVKTAALSINPVDVKARNNENTLKWLFGEEPPVILGWDISGEVTAIGNNVTQFQTGDKVFGMINFPGKGNAYAEYVVAPAAHLSLKPGSIDHPEAAAATLAALTAWQTLQHNIRKGDKVLIHGASGGVGHYAVQIAKYLGAYVIGTSSAKNKEFVLQQGANEHIDYTAGPLENQVSGLDLVLDTIAGETILHSVNVTRQGGTVITIPSGSIPEEYLALAAQRGVDLKFILVQSSGEDMSTIAGLLDKGILKSHVSHTFPFREMNKAHLQLETGRTVGKVVVTL